MSVEANTLPVMFVPGEVVSYLEMCREEGVNLQRGMNFRLRGQKSVVLMSVRKGAPYADRVEEDGRVLVYEGHDVPIDRPGLDPKAVDQPLITPAGTPTQNGLFMRAVNEYKAGRSAAEHVHVYEKIRTGIWVYNGLFKLAYLGPRRAAASNLRRRDVDLERGLIRFREKGGKVNPKPIPEEFAHLLRTAIVAGVIGDSADSYIIPMVRKQRTKGNRDPRIVYRTVKRLADRAGIENAHVHAVRAAFAVQFLDTHPWRAGCAATADGSHEGGYD